jgi:hypothetical protein
MLYAPVVVIHVNRKITPTRAPEQKGRGSSARYVIAAEGLRWSASGARARRDDRQHREHGTAVGLTGRFFFHGRTFIIIYARVCYHVEKP